MKFSPKHRSRQNFTVNLVNLIGSWFSVFLHTLFFAAWFYFGLKLELLLVIVSLEAIYLGIFILMAENVETMQKEEIRAKQRENDLAVVKKDVEVDEISLKKLKALEKQINTLHNLMEKKIQINQDNQ